MDRASAHGGTLVPFSFRRDRSRQPQTIDDDWNGLMVFSGDLERLAGSRRQRVKNYRDELAPFR